MNTYDCCHVTAKFTQFQCVQLCFLQYSNARRKIAMTSFGKAIRGVDLRIKCGLLQDARFTTKTKYKIINIA